VRLALLLVFFLGCSSSGGDMNADIDAGGVDASAECVPYSERVCFDGNAHWTDGCGTVLELIEECGDQQSCSPDYGKCCAAVVSSGVVPAYPWPVRLNWTFLDPGAELTADIRIDTDPGQARAMNLDVDLHIDGVHVFFSLENALPPEVGTGSKKGIRFYRVGSSDSQDARTTVGTKESSTAGAGQIVVRYHHDWPAGSRHVLRIARESAQGEADWFDLSVSDGVGSETVIGGLLVPRQTAGVPASIESTPSTWFKILDFDWSNIPPTFFTGGAVVDYSDIRDVSARVELSMGGAVPTSVRSAYGKDAEDSEWLNTEAGILDGELHMSWGPTVSRCTEAGLLR
jgi:hypothetical protein